MSRDSDKYLDLKERTDMANAWEADYFLSVHINAGGGTGFESYVYNGSKLGATLNNRKIIHDEIMKQINVRDRGEKEQNFHVLRETNMPASLYEFLFIDNENDAKLLKKESTLNGFAIGTVNGLEKALKLKK